MSDLKSNSDQTAILDLTIYVFDRSVVLTTFYYDDPVTQKHHQQTKPLRYSRCCIAEPHFWPFYSQEKRH